MALYALADLHLSSMLDKKMDKFGENWINHGAKIEENWLNTVADDDTVIIGGDVSWAMRLNEAEADLKFIDSLPGKKIIHSGNHDYWWDSASKLNGMFESIFFMKNDFCSYGEYAICGSRGWLCPNGSHFSAHDEKIYKREIIRCHLSFDKAIRAGYEKFIFTLHFPPTNDKKEQSEFTEIAEKYKVKQVVYGHLHGEKSFGASLSGEFGGTIYSLVSADYLNFTPKLLME
ncbi:metallophosphoesterase [Tyzzerella sp. OttesenSCG-928-J15]|nr:metallophosphoesterase [Tyzzerella sp. OttesenSCG-928-J15]